MIRYPLLTKDSTVPVVYRDILSGQVRGRYNFNYPMAERLHLDWLQGRASLGAASGWSAEEMRLIADLGYALAEQGRNEEAITVFEGLAALAPNTAYFQSALGALWLRRNEPQRALEHLEAALLSDARDVAALVNRGEARLQIGDAALAVKDLEIALHIGEARTERHIVSCVHRARALLTRWQHATGRFIASGDNSTDAENQLSERKNS